MHEFFRGSRRKAGSVTLVLACVLTGGWLRSFIVSDILLFTDGFTSVSLDSLKGKLHLIEGTDSTQYNEPTKLIFPEWHIVACKDIPDPDAPVPAELDHYWKVNNKTLFEFMGFGVNINESGSRHEGFRNRDIAVPYWSITFPLTLLSAFLLLSKPRPRQLLASTKPLDEARVLHA